MKGTTSLLKSLGLLSASILLLSCGEETTGNGDNKDKPCVLADGGKVTIIYPSGGETFKVGDTVTVKVAYNADNNSDLNLELSLDEDKFNSIVKNPISAEIALAEGEQCAEHEWIIGQENFQVPYQNNNSVKLKASGYIDPTMSDITGSITITK